jgi:hypothetical protein
MLATDVKTLHQNKIYLVQFSLKQIKTSIFFVIFGFTNLQKNFTKTMLSRIALCFFFVFPLFFFLICGRVCHMQRGFVESATWRRLKMKSTCSLFVLIHRKLGNAFV